MAYFQMAYLQIYEADKTTDKDLEEMIMRNEVERRKAQSVFSVIDKQHVYLTGLQRYRNQNAPQ